MNTFFDKATQDEFRQRLENLNLEAKDGWGNVGQRMHLCHHFSAVWLPNLRRLFLIS